MAKCNPHKGLRIRPIAQPFLDCASISCSSDLEIGWKWAERINGTLTTLGVELFSVDEGSQFCCGCRNRPILIPDVDRAITF
jgi:hypothetical protein